MKALAEMIIAVADLVEAESRQIRRAYIQKNVMNVIFLALALFSTVGTSLVVWAIYRGLVTLSGQVAGSFLTGVLILSLSGGTLWTIRRLAVR